MICISDSEDDLDVDVEEINPTEEEQAAWRAREDVKWAAELLKHR